MAQVIRDWTVNDSLERPMKFQKQRDGSNVGRQLIPTELVQQLEMNGCQ